MSKVLIVKASAFSNITYKFEEEIELEGDESDEEIRQLAEEALWEDIDLWYEVKEV